MFESVKARIAHFLWQVTDIGPEFASLESLNRPQLILAMAAAVSGCLCALVLLASGDAAWNIVAAIGLLTLTTGTLYCLIRVDDTR